MSRDDFDDGAGCAFGLLLFLAGLAAVWSLAPRVAFFIEELVSR